MMRYEEPLPILRTQAEVTLASGNVNEICDTLVRLALHDRDWRWVQDRCLEFARNPNPMIRACAATCLGHLARIHKTLDVDTVLPVLDQLLLDPEVAGSAEDALDDIRTYLPNIH